jgi:hypothetical protein
MSEPYNGKCPICQGQLFHPLDPAMEGSHVVEVSIMTSLLECENHDYSCKTADFETAWNNYDNVLGPDYSRAVTELMEALLTANLKKGV